MENFDYIVEQEMGARNLEMELDEALERCNRLLHQALADRDDEPFPWGD